MIPLLLYILISLLTGAIAVSLMAWMLFHLRSSSSRAVLIALMVCIGTFISVATLSILFKQPLLTLNAPKFVTLAFAFIIYAVIVDLIQNEELDHARKARKFFMFFLTVLFLTALALIAYLFDWYEKIQRI